MWSFRRSFCVDWDAGADMLSSDILAFSFRCCWFCFLGAAVQGPATNSRKGPEGHSSVTPGSSKGSTNKLKHFRRHLGCSVRVICNYVGTFSRNRKSRANHLRVSERKNSRSTSYYVLMQGVKKRSSESQTF